MIATLRQLGSLMEAQVCHILNHKLNWTSTTKTRFIAALLKIATIG